MIRRLAPRVALAAVIASGCTSSVPPETDETPPVDAPDTPSETLQEVEQTAEPSPTPVQAVEGVRQLAAWNLSTSGMLDHQGPDPGDPDVVVSVAHEVGDWLDAHLDDLQRGGQGLLDEVAAPGLLAAADPATLAAATTDLSAENRPVDTAQYVLAGSFTDDVEWIEASVTTTAPDGTQAAVTFVFTVDNGAIALQLFGPATQAPQ